MSRPRRKPYTILGLRRLRCTRCGAPARCQWSACADGNVWRPLCAECDIALNELSLRFMRIPDAEAKLEWYRAELLELDR